MPTTILLALPNCLTLRHPCSGVQVRIGTHESLADTLTLFQLMGADYAHQLGLSHQCLENIRIDCIL